MRLPGFVGGMFVSLNSTVENEETTNFYVEDTESGGATSKRQLLPTPGVAAVGSEYSSGLVGRGNFAVGNRQFCVISTAFVEVDEDGIKTLRGTVAVDDNPATMISNGDTGDQVLVVSGGVAYVFTLSTNAFAAVAVPRWSYATMCFGPADGYGNIMDATTGTWYVSNLNDFATWAANRAAQRSLASDPWIAGAVLGRFVFLCGAYTAEQWFNTGGASFFPFQPFSSGLMQNGCAAPFSLDVAADRLCWLEQTSTGGPRVVAAAGLTPEVISTRALESWLNGFARVNDAIGDALTIAGHTFYILHFPEEDVTIAYDFTSREWIKFADTTDGEFTAWRPRFNVYVYGQCRMVDSATGNVFRLGVDLPNAANGDPVVRLRRAPILENEMQRVFINRFELSMETGLGLATGQGSDPQVMMRSSNDGGKTWGSERWASAGKIGEYGRRVVWYRCGMGRRKVFEIRMSDPIPWRVADAFVDVEIEDGQGRAA